MARTGGFAEWIKNWAGFVGGLTTVFVSFAGALMTLYGVAEKTVKPAASVAGFAVAAVVAGLGAYVANRARENLRKKPRKATVTVSLDSGVLDSLDRKRGTLSRAGYVRKLIEREVR